MSVTQEIVKIESNKKSVKVFKPKAIVLGFHGTIAPIDWEDNIIVPYIRQHLKEYLTNNWNNNNVHQLISELKHESFDQHFVYENNECPVIADDEEDLSEQISSVNDFLIWQMNNRKETQDSQTLFKLVWTDGLNNERIHLRLFDDVVPALTSFRESHKIQIALFSSVNTQVCQQIFRNTTEGDINQYFDHYFTGGFKNIESFRNIATELKVEPKDILFVIDSGQSAKCAHELGYNCLLIKRPNNRKIREYYLLRFNSISSLLDIEFVRRQ